jgi:oxygen-independent coproporphyrinogen-3 oxidase
MLAKNIAELLAKHPELNIQHDQYNINVTANSGEVLAPNAVAKAYQEHEGSGKPAHLYFHVPLCNYLCHFCNYVKKLVPAHGREAALSEWVGLLIDESSRYLTRFPWVREANIESFYIGGGTAAVLGLSHLQKLMEHVFKNYNMNLRAEISLEGNPDNLTEDYINGAVALGFNRFSVGIQSLQDEVSTFVGRKHDRAMSLKSIAALKATGLPFNCDYMFGLPNQTVATIQDDIETLAALDVPTITIYRLRNADRAAMGIGNKSAWNNPRVMRAMQEKNLFPSLSETYGMRAAIMDVFERNGYKPSPCGWWSKEGVYADGIPQVSRNKWEKFDTMIAHGPGAYGWLTGGTGQIIQTHNITDIAQYGEVMKDKSSLPMAPGKILEGYRAVGTAFGFKLKANQWLDLAAFASEWGVDLLNDPQTSPVVREMLAKDLLVQSADGTKIRPSAAGEALHEEMISVYAHERIGGCGERICKRL